MLDKLNFHESEVIWSLDSKHPRLWQHLVRAYPWIEAVHTKLREGCPSGTSLEPFEQDNCVRPPNHFRTFYIKHVEGPVLAIKGSEVVNDELERAFRQFYSLGRRWAPTEVFPLNDQTLALAVHVPEAIDEVTTTARFQEEYLLRFGALADFPLHLMAYRFPETVSENYFRSLGKFASGRCMHQSKLLAQEGLAAYVYFFPHLPLRLAQLIPSEGFGAGIFDVSTREAVLRETCNYDPRTAAETFFSLSGRMLALGYFPLNMQLANACTSAQSVTTKGAIVGESLYPFEKVKSDWEFSTVFLTTLATLCATARVLLYSPLPNVRFEFQDPSVISILMMDFVWDRVRREVAACAKSGMKIDARLERMLSHGSLDKIFDVVAQMHPKREDFILFDHLTSPPDNRGWD